MASLDDERPTFEKHIYTTPTPPNEEHIREYCAHSPMLKTAQFTSYRAAFHSAPITKKPHWANLTRAVNIHTSSNLRSSSTSAKPDFRMTGNRQDQPPKHEMVHFKNLLSEKRAFGDFRTVLHTGLYSQLVAMEVPVGGDIGDEVHTVDQILLFTSGKGLATVAGKDQEVQAGDVVIVPAGTQHQFVTKGDQPLELITVYSPAEHSPSTVHKTKEQGDEEEDNGKDEAPAWSRKSKKENEDAGLVKLSGKY